MQNWIRTMIIALAVAANTGIMTGCEFLDDIECVEYENDFGPFGRLLLRWRCEPKEEVQSRLEDQLGGWAMGFFNDNLDLSEDDQVEALFGDIAKIAEFIISENCRNVDCLTEHLQQYLTDEMAQKAASSIVALLETMATAGS